MNPIENAILILTNDCAFYKRWRGLMLHKEGLFEQQRRNTIKEFLERNHEDSLSQDARDRIRLHFEKEWSVEHFIGKKQQIEVQQPKAAPTKQEEIQMSIAKQSVEIKSVTYLNGVDITTLTKEQLIDAIAQCEADLKRMSELKTKSKAIDDKRTAIQATIDQIVGLLDK